MSRHTFTHPKLSLHSNVVILYVIHAQEIGKNQEKNNMRRYSCGAVHHVVLYRVILHYMSRKTTAFSVSLSCFNK